MLFRAFTTLVIIAIVAGPLPTLARARHTTHPNKAASSTDGQPQRQPASSAASDYNNHVVENGMTQDKLDRTPVR